MANVGDYVRFLNDIGGGRITRINGNTAYVIDSDGFETPALLRECVVVPSDKPSSLAVAVHQTSPSSAIAENPAPAPQAETAEGEKLTVAVIFEPHDIKRLSATEFDALLVNDSNYHLQYNIATRERDDVNWTLFASGTVEPNTQILLDEVTRDDLPAFDRLSVQLTAYKTGKPYELKLPISVETKIDTTKFVRLHCFSKSPYSPVPVLTIPIVTDDRPYRQISMTGLSDIELSSATIKADDRRPKTQLQSGENSGHAGPAVVDLHIDQLLDSTAGMNNADILSRQIEEFHRHMKALKNKPGSKIIFIHGKGEGVLRHTILDQLRRYYPKCTSQDASFREYGFGATQITIH
jgi:hypothetical protein